MANRQHVKNAVEVSEYNVAANLFEMRSGTPWKGKGHGGDDADVINAFMPDDGAMPGDADGSAGGRGGSGSNNNSWEGSDGAAFAACWKKLKVTVVGPENFEKNFASRAKNQGYFDAVVVGAWQVQRVTPALGGTAKKPKAKEDASGGDGGSGGGGGGGDAGGVMILEGAKYFVFMDKKASTEFAVKSSLLADAAGFAPVPPSAAAAAAEDEAPAPAEAGSSTDSPTVYEPADAFQPANCFKPMRASADVRLCKSNVYSSYKP